jgi:hypothetical protein
MAEEVTIYRDANIHVTNLRAILENKTYAMANVTSVSLYTQAANKTPSVILIALGVFFSLPGFGASELRGCLPLGLIIAGVGVLWFFLAKDIHWVRIGSASGETNALSSRDLGYIVHIVNAMNEAFVRRG